MTTETINIRIREDGSRVVSRNIEEIGDSSRESAGDVDILSKALGLLAGAFAIDKLQQWSDAWGTAGGLIRTATKSVEEAAAVQDALYKSAQKTRSEYTSVVELYSRAARASNDLGASQADVIKFTEGVGKALAIQGTSAAQASGALLQLGQALGNGKIQAEEYNSLLDGGQVILQTVANNLDGAAGSVGKLTKMVKSGEVGSKEFFDAFLKGSEQLDADFAKTSMTFGQGWQVIENGVIKYVGQMNEALGISNKFGEFAQWLAANMPQVAAAITAVGIAVAVAFAPGKIVAFYAQIQKLWVLMLANPFVAVAAAVAAVVSYLVIMRDEIKLGIDDTTTLGDLMRAAWEDIGPAITAALDLAAQFFAWLSNTSAGTFDQMLNDLVGYEHQSDSTWLKILRVVVQVFDMIGGTIRGVMAGVNAVVMKFVGAWINNFQQLGNVVSAIASGDIDAIKAAVKNNLDGYKEAATGAGEAFSAAFQQEILSQSDSGLESLLDGWIDRAKQIGAERNKGAQAAVDLTTRPGGGSSATDPDKDAAKKAARELAQLQRALRQLQDQVDPVSAATRELADAETVLTKAMAKGLITADEKADIYGRLKDQLKQALDPYGFMVDELKRETDMLKLNSEQHEVQADLYQRVQELQRSGVKLTQEGTAALQAQLETQQELTRLAQVRDQLEAGSQQRRARDLTDKIGQAGAMAADPNSGFTKGDAVNQLAGDIPGLDQTADFLAAQQEQYAAYYAAIDEMRNADLISETGAVQAKIAIFQQQYAAQFQAASDALGALASLQRSENKKQAAIGKAAAIAQTIINTYSSATSAYSAMAGIPYVGPFLGAAAAAAAVVAGMANVQAIRSQNVGNFRTGGEFMVGGSGGTDSQQINLRATPGERIQINTPAQARALERADELQTEGGRTAVVNQTVNQTFMSKPDRTTDRQQARALRKSAQKDFVRT